MCISLVPRPLPAFRCFTQRSGRAWYTLARDGRIVVALYPGRIHSELRVRKPTVRPSKVLRLKFTWHDTLRIWLGPRRIITVLPSRANMYQALRPASFVKQHKAGSCLETRLVCIGNEPSCYWIPTSFF